jgi:DNA-binding winged helix-turn-helix (wHTH) protein
LPEELSLVTSNGELRLSETEYRLLSALFLADGAEVDCQILFCRVWEGKPLNVNLLRVTVSHLRQRLKDADISVVSTRGGYRLEF